MIKLNDEPLKKHTTVKIGGIAHNYYIPQDLNDIIQLSEEMADKKIYIISGGSNLLISDLHAFENVISMEQACTEIKFLDDGTICCGASVRIQKLINNAKVQGLGGIEYLYSLPAMLGGIICMNAGRGIKFGESISDHIVEVYAIKDGREYVFSKDDCQFGYRTSIFKGSNYIITGAKLQLNPMEISQIEEGIQSRMNLCREIQDHTGSTFGSVFSCCNEKIMGIMQKFFSNTKGVHWSKKRGNWLINDGTGTYTQAMRRMRICKVLHHLISSKIEEEVIIWE